MPPSRGYAVVFAGGTVTAPSEHTIVAVSHRADPPVFVTVRVPVAPDPTCCDAAHAAEVLEAISASCVRVP